MKKLYISVIVLSLMFFGGCSFISQLNEPEAHALMSEPTEEPFVQGPGGLLPPAN